MAAQRPECTLPAEDRAYPRTEASPPFRELEEQVAAYWEEDETFAATQDPARADQDEFGDGTTKTCRVLDQPPAIEATDGTAQLLAGYQLDTLARLQTMEGKLVPRPFGVQAHGLVVEREVQRRFKLKDKAAIEAYGVERFVEACRARAQERLEAWPHWLARQGRWADLAGAVSTHELPYMESVWWAFKTLHDLEVVQLLDEPVETCARCGCAFGFLELDALDPSEKDPAGAPACPSCRTRTVSKKLAAWYLAPEAAAEAVRRAVRQVTWYPARIQEELIDPFAGNPEPLLVSRERYWGTAVPVWRCSSKSKCPPEVFGSVAELEAAFGTEVGDLHPGALDQLTRACPKCKKGTQKRFPGVLVPWFESACSGFARTHHPFEEGADPKPAPFATYAGGALEPDLFGWAYPSLVISAALFGEPPSLAVAVVSRLVPDRVWVTEVMDDDLDPALKVEERPYWLDDEPHDPDDPVAWDPKAPATHFRHMVSDALRADLLRGLPTERFTEGLRRLHRVWSVFHFFCTAANDEKVKVDTAEPLGDLAAPEDRWILTCLHKLSIEIRDKAGRTRLSAAYDRFDELLDRLAEYLAMGRARFFKKGQDPDKAAAFRVLFRLLVELSRCLAPFAPFLAEVIFLSLTQARSVHLARWPDPTLIPTDQDTWVRLEAARALRGR